MHRIGKIDDSRIRKLRECKLAYSEAIRVVQDDCWYTDHRDKEETFFECIQPEPVQISDDISVKFHEEEQVVPLNNGGQARRFKRQLIICSDKYRPREICQILDHWQEDYLREKECRLVENQMIFNIRFDSEGQQHTFSSPFHTFRNFDNFIFDQKEEVLKELEFFETNEKWYESRGLQHTLGILCHGEPGCGKTSFIKSLIKKTNRHAIIFSINEFTNLECIEKVMRTDTISDYPIPQNKRIYVFEDIDAMRSIILKRNDKTNRKHGKSIVDLFFEKKEAANSQHLGFFLNLLDGVLESPGRILVITTNFIKKIDPALIRPGRIDLSLEFKRCSRLQIHKILALFYAVENIDLPIEITDYCITPGQLAQVCRSCKKSIDVAIEQIQLHINNQIELNIGKEILQSYNQTGDPLNCYECQMKGIIDREMSEEAS